MAVPIGGRLSAAFRETYEQAGITQATIADHLQANGWPTVDQPKVSKWGRGMERIPLEVVPELDAACGVPVGTILRRAGYVNDTHPTVEQVIQSDMALTAKDRDTLLDLYLWLRERSSISPYASPR
jgi:hypothetical protein